MSPNRLNSAALPSITGSAAAGPRLPSPSTADPSVTTAMLFRLMVSRRASSGFFAIARQTRATPGCRSSTGRHGCGSGACCASRSCRQGASGTCDRETLPITTPGTPRIASTSSSACSVSRAAQVTSIRSRSWPGRGDVERGNSPAGLLDSGRQLADRGPSRRNLQPHSDRVRDGWNGCHGPDPLTA